MTSKNDTIYGRKMVESMTNIVFYKNKNDQMSGFDISGHTDFALSGSDVLCAAVSALCSHTIGSIQEFTNEPCENIVDETAPKVIFRLTEPDLSDESQLFLESFASSADDLAFAHPDNITVEYKEN
ncbi:MAG: ribosomal-processing cysteine protease Prp [Clostridiales bacterium]|nr:ribosomal-processing cysteine protease Prp [Clostridiales bacterium]